MRLGLYIPIIDERPAGVGVYIDEICSRLLQMLPDAVVYTGSPEVHRPWLKTVRVKELGARRLPDFGVLTGARRRLRRLRWLSGAAAVELRDDNVDVLFSPVQEGPLVGTIPSIVVLHDVTALRFPRGYGRFTVAQTRWVLPLMLRRAHTVVAVSENTKADAVREFGLSPERIAVVGEGYDKSVFRPRHAVECADVRSRLRLPLSYLLYAGTFSRHKNLGVLLDVLASLSDTHAQLNLVLVGRIDAGDFGEFKSKARRLGLSRRVFTPGYVSRDDLARLMSGAEAFVYPTQYEGFGLAALEAMACGARVVASAVASLPEVVGEGGFLVHSPTPEAWRDAVLTALASTKAVASSRATAHAAKFDWQGAALSIADLLTEAVRSSGP